MAANKTGLYIIDPDRKGAAPSKPRDAKLLEGMTDPQPFPPWLTEEDLTVYCEAFAAGGFTGPINRYRAQRIDFEELTALRGATLEQPACFIAGERDAVRHFIPGGDLYADPGAACTDLRVNKIVPGAGHWVQQEAPEAVNAMLAAFLQGEDVPYLSWEARLLDADPAAR